jgi:hypothetical protein
MKRRMRVITTLAVAGSLAFSLSAPLSAQAEGARPADGAGPDTAMYGNDGCSDVDAR